MAIGDAVIFVDRVGRERAAVVTAVWGGSETHRPSLNVVIVSDDESKTDVYGRQIERETSVPHQKEQQAHGYYWKEIAQ